MKYNFISNVQDAKPILPRQTVKQKSGDTNDAFIMKCKRAVNKCEIKYGVLKPPQVATLENDCIVIVQ